MTESKPSRRGVLSAIAAGVVGLAVGAGVGWSLKAPEVRERVQTVTAPGDERTVTVTGPGRETTLTVTREVTKEVTPVRKLPSDVVKIGVLGIRSGPWATYGTFIEQGARLAAEEINAAGGILGSKIELSIRDEAADVVKQARELVEAEKVDFLIGVDSSGNAMRVGPIMQELNKILIVTHAATHRLTEELVYRQKIKSIFRVSVPVYHDGILAAYVAKDLPIKKWAGINPDYEYGRVSWDFFKKTLSSLKPDVEFVSEQFNKSPGTTDFSPFISAVLAAGAEGVFSANWALEAATMHKQLRSLGAYDRLLAVINPMGYSMDVAYELGAEYPTAKYGTWVSGRYVWFYPATEINRRFVEAFRKRWGKYPPYSSETTYTAIYLIKAALESAGTFDLDTLVKQIEDRVIMSPAGVRWIRPEDHQALYDVPYGKVTHVGGEIPQLTNLVTRSAWEYFRHPPFT
ncbi:MAG: ABC transporter substrate-binding protein [Candidatus Caldarchaeum sp.]